MLFDPKWQKAEIKPVSDLKALLLKAADLIDQHGLAKQIQLDEKGRMCVHGAISVAMFGRPYATNALHHEAIKALNAHLGLDYYRGGATWNNQPERTKEEVVQALRGAAERVQTRR